MCSVTEPEFDDALECMEGLEGDNLKNPLPSLCKKCNEKPPKVVLRLKDVYCEGCFLAAMKHKFRAALGKTRLVRPGDKVLIAYSGGASSAALLHLVNDGLTEDSHKKLRFEPVVIYVDEGPILKHTLEQRYTSIADVSQQLKGCPFPSYVVSFTQTFNDEVTFEPLSDKPTIDCSHDTNLTNVLDGLQTLSAQEDFVKKIRQNLLVSVAKKLSCAWVFLADVGTDIALTLLSNVAMGRGAQLPHDVGFCDSRDDSVGLLRPLRDFMRKEIVYYAEFMSIPSLTRVSLSTGESSHASIQRLTEHFLLDLQEKFPATLHTVLRTGDKLSAGDKESKDTLDKKPCAFCQARLDTTVTASSALQATELSRIISSGCRNGFQSSDDNNIPLSETENTCKCKDCTASISDNDIDITLSDIEACLCYGCRLIVRDITDIKVLPNNLIEAVKVQKELARIRNGIADYLL